MVVRDKAVCEDVRLKMFEKRRVKVIEDPIPIWVENLLIGSRAHNT